MADKHEYNKNPEHDKTSSNTNEDRFDANEEHPCPEGSQPLPPLDLVDLQRQILELHEKMDEAIRIMSTIALSPNSDGDLIDLTQTAELLKISRRTAIRRVERGDLPARRVKRDKYYKWYFSKKEIEDYLEDCF
ncbi:helix-turn-helix domain-containing protein [Pelagicoccus sp. SDUM812005]|uniref:helix-turn-helix domain-containing protein n=1 Tax=Pelagicoccus sp. SDUM812005 TaxID=3041257 RepID=UPI002810746D|nr:helix-turn-helix domain-containing protein [Pelagicoccus sp. SDUM812005]MDQ8182198.1 helix-turn-helix domain-containing protein [Pelagicoccus sp. SDUM812005]